MPPTSSWHIESFSLPQTLDPEPLIFTYTQELSSLSRSHSLQKDSGPKQEGLQILSRIGGGAQTSQYRKTKVRASHRKTQRYISKNQQGSHHTFLHLIRERESSDVSHSSQTLYQQPHLAAPVPKQKALLPDFFSRLTD